MNPNSTSFGQSVLADSYAPARTAVQTGNISPPESCHANEDEKDKQAPPRLPLPCIREVLGNNLPLPYLMQILLPRIQSAHTAPSSHQIRRPSAGRMPTPPNNLIGPVTWSPMWDNGFPHQSQVQEEGSHTDPTSITTEESENMSLVSLSTGKSPIQSAKTDIIPISESLNPSELDNVHLRAPVTAQIAFSKRRIPRLHKEVSFSKTRVSHACGPCHITKARCSGESPGCQRCRTSKKECWYPQRKHEYTQRKVEQLSSQVHDYKAVLQQIYSRANAEDAKLISNVLSKHL